MPKNKIVTQVGFVCICLAAMAACKVPALTEKTENTATPAAYGVSPQQDTTNMAQRRWKDYFADPYLNALIDTALKNNQELNITLQEIEVAKTPLQTQIQSFVRRMVLFGAIAFLLVLGMNYYHSHNFLFGLLQGLTLAMSVLPEEIPVAFSAFQALGAFRLLKNNIIVKQPQFVETLGSATVICIDKTGTITQNLMHIEYVYDAATKSSVHNDASNILPHALIEYAMWSSETEPFDPMEKAIHELYEKITSSDERKNFKQVHEYPIGGKPPMMTHIFKNDAGITIIAAKGAPEAILRHTNLSIPELKHVEEQSLGYAKQGYRVLGVGKGIWNEKNYPASQEELVLNF